MNMVKHLIVGNWKMNPGTLAEAKKIARRVRRVAQRLVLTEVVVCPPFPFIADCVSRKPVKNFHLGSQTVSFREGSGAFTGEVSASMLADIGAKFVIIGHSERRKSGDAEETVSKRALAALNAGLTAIVCVGENERDRDGAYLGELKNQIQRSFSGIPRKYAKKITIAYEPVWEIGGKEAMSPEQIYETSLFVRKVFADIFGTDNGLGVKVLYGGSVTFRNAPDIISVGKVDGLLVGHESVNVVGFIELLKAIDELV